MSRFDRINYGDRPTDPTQEDLKEIFRAGELQRREARMKIMKNHTELEHERLTPADREIDARVRAKLVESHLALEKTITPSYWKRLWAALRGK